jgi:hypothetical protein
MFGVKTFNIKNAKRKDIRVTSFLGGYENLSDDR